MLGRNTECWIPGTLEPWNPGTLELWNPGTLEPWNFGTLELWNPGSPSHARTSRTAQQGYTRLKSPFSKTFALFASVVFGAASTAAQAPFSAAPVHRTAPDAPLHRTAPSAPDAPSAPVALEVTPFLRDATRVESWSFFEPRRDPVDASYWLLQQPRDAGRARQESATGRAGRVSIRQGIRFAATRNRSRPIWSWGDVLCRRPHTCGLSAVFQSAVTSHEGRDAGRVRNGRAHGLQVGSRVAIGRPSARRDQA